MDWQGQGRVDLDYAVRGPNSNVVQKGETKTKETGTIEHQPKKWGAFPSKKQGKDAERGLPAAILWALCHTCFWDDRCFSHCFAADYKGLALLLPPSIFLTAHARVYMRHHLQGLLG